MEIIEVDSINSYLKRSIFIGMGTTAMCFKTRDNEVVKKYINSSRKQELFSKVDMLERLKLISEIQNDTYIGPDKVLVNNGTVLGYIYPYIDAVILKRIDLSTKLFDLYRRYNKLLKDTEDLSNQGFRLFDVHLRNILFNGTYYVIDLDKGYIMDIDSKLLQMYNAECLKNNIIGLLFKVAPWEIVQFLDTDLQKAFVSSDWGDLESIYDFLVLLSDRCENYNPSIREVRRKIKVHKFENSYYKS